MITYRSLRDSVLGRTAFTVSLKQDSPHVLTVTENGTVPSRCHKLTEFENTYDQRYLELKRIHKGNLDLDPEDLSKFGITFWGSGEKITGEKMIELYSDKNVSESMYAAAKVVVRGVSGATPGAARVAAVVTSLKRSFSSESYRRAARLMRTVVDLDIPRTQCSRLTTELCLSVPQDSVSGAGCDHWIDEGITELWMSKTLRLYDWAIPSLAVSGLTIEHLRTLLVCVDESAYEFTLEDGSVCEDLVLAGLDELDRQIAKVRLKQLPRAYIAGVRMGFIPFEE